MNSTTVGLARLLPGATVLALTLVGTTHWGEVTELTDVSGGDLVHRTSPAAVLPLIPIFTWALWRPGGLSALVVFLAGLLVDAVTAGPLGFWPLIYLLGLALARAARGRVPAASMTAGWSMFAVTAALLASAAWAVSSLTQLQPMAWPVLAWPFGIAVAVFPVLAAMLLGMARWTKDAGVARWPTTK